jgi:hypothetical protein
MSDDKTKTGGQDRKRINVNEDFELRDWAKKFDSTPQQIKEAVQAVGDEASNVEEHLKGSRATTNAERTRQASGGKERSQ